MLCQRPPLVAVLLSVACACSSSTPRREGRDSEVRSGVLQTFDSLARAIRSLNVEEMLSFYSTDSSIVRALDGRDRKCLPQVERELWDGDVGLDADDRADRTVLAAREHEYQHSGDHDGRRDAREQGWSPAPGGGGVTTFRQSPQRVKAAPQVNNDPGVWVS